MLDGPCHFSIVTSGKCLMISSDFCEKPPPGPSCSAPWKNTGSVAQLNSGFLHVLHTRAGGLGGGSGGSGGHDGLLWLHGPGGGGCGRGAALIPDTWPAPAP